MKHFLGIVPPAGASAQIDALRSRFAGRLVRHLQPHVTVVPPVDLRHSDEWVYHIVEVLASIRPFALAFGQPAYFGQRVLFLSVREPDADSRLPALQRALWVGTVEHCRQYGESFTHQDRSYHPHLTLAMQSFGTSPSELRLMEVEGAGLAAELPNFVVQQVRVFHHVDGRWATRCDLPLG